MFFLGSNIHRLFKYWFILPTSIFLIQRAVNKKERFGNIYSIQKLTIKYFLIGLRIKGPRLNKLMRTTFVTWIIDKCTTVVHAKLMGNYCEHVKVIIAVDCRNIEDWKQIKSMYLISGL